MATNTIMIDGTLYADGKLQLDQMPNIAPGRVTVLLQPALPNQHGRRGGGGLAPAN